MKDSLYHHWRKKRRGYQRRMATANRLGMALLTILVLLGLWWDTHCTGYFYSSEYEELSFLETSERVATWVDAYRREQGHLPDTLNTGWLYMERDNPWVFYVDTTRWDRMPIEYRHWGDSTYFIKSSRWNVQRFVSSPRFKGYLFYRWDWEEDSLILIRVDTVYRRQ